MKDLKLFFKGIGKMVKEGFVTAIMLIGMLSFLAILFTVPAKLTWYAIKYLWNLV